MPHSKSFQVYVFGGLRVHCPDGSTAKLQTCRARALLALLLINRKRMIHREMLCSQLWPNLTEAVAKSQLRKTLWRVRSAFSPWEQENDSPMIRISEHQVGLDHTQFEVDYWRFIDIMEALEFKADSELNNTDAQSLLDAIGINSDTFATGIFDDWCLAEQAVMQQARLEALERIVGYHRANEHWVQAIHWAQQAISLDPIREHLHYAVIASRYSMGDRASAIRQYKCCEKVLNEELAIRPSLELRALYQRITTEHTNTTPSVNSKPITNPGPVYVSPQLASRFDAAINSLAAIRDSLEGSPAKPR